MTPKLAIVMMMLCINILWITFALLTLCLTRIVIKSRTYLKQMFPLPLDKLNESHEELAKKYALLFVSNNELLARHNKLVIEHEELTSSYKELENSKFDHPPSNTPSSNDEKPSVAKVDASTSCNYPLDMPCSSSCIDNIVIPCSPLCNELSSFKTNLARK